jgi:transcription elongation GreA/GreB family factor
MLDGHAGCPYERAYSAEYRGLKEDLGELKTRVNDLERLLMRGLLLLVANLAGMIVTLARELL